MYNRVYKFICSISGISNLKILIAKVPNAPNPISVLCSEFAPHSLESKLYILQALAQRPPILERLQ